MNVRCAALLCGTNSGTHAPHPSPDCPSGVGTAADGAGALAQRADAQRANQQPATSPLQHPRCSNPRASTPTIHGHRGQAQGRAVESAARAAQQPLRPCATARPCAWHRPPSLCTRLHPSAAPFLEHLLRRRTERTPTGLAHKIDRANARRRRRGSTCSVRVSPLRRSGRCGRAARQ